MEDYRRLILIDRLNTDLYIEKAVLEALKAEQSKTFVMRALIVQSETKIKVLQELLDKTNNK